VNLPQTHEGRQVWALVQHLDGQVRVAGNGAVIGFDMGAALAMAQAGGIDSAAVAALLPAVEVAMVAKINEQMRMPSD
jgi:hypothetical protein